LAFRDTHDVPELLAPAGGPEPFRAALAAGADAIFCGLGSDFNARRGAGNFTYETFAQACREAHLLGARVYVTQNVVIKGDEMPRALALLRKAWLLGADAFIIQDWGLLAEARRLWPRIECHISTQANVHDARATRWCGELGAERVTLSRELSVAEIGRIAREGVELESFGHGALCFCYSGVCMMSSLRGGRSANRGLCAQPCRLPYDLVDGDGNVISAPGAGRPLCPKDFRTLDDLPRLTAAGLGSLKVEGRMKAPDYVYSVISAYRAQLDDLAAGREVTEADDAARSRTLARAFNRDFTNSYLDGRSDNDMMSYDRSNNRGELVGTVVATRDLGSAKVRRGGGSGGRDRFRTVTMAEVDVRLDAPVGAGDLLEVRPQDDPSQFLTTRAEADAAPAT
jgi:putative protease